MIKITEIIVKRPVSAIIMILAIVVFGVMSIVSMPLELTPEMEMPIMLVATVYPGAGAEDVEDLVTREIEGAVGSLSGMDSLTSYSMENMSIVMVQYEYGTNMDTAYTDIKEKIDGIINDMPDDIQTPRVIEMDINAMATVTLSVSSLSEGNLLNYVEDEIIPEFEKLSSVSDVTVSGGREEYIRVELQEDKLNQYGITMSTVISSVSTADFSIPSGTVDFGNQDLSAHTAVQYRSTESLKNIPIPLGDGNFIRLQDVANIYDAVKDAESISSYDGNEDISLGIQKRQSASAVTASNQIMKIVEEINATDDSIHIAVVNDSSDMITDSIISVAQTLGLAIILSMLVLYIFLGDIKASLIVGSSMPVSVLVAFIAMNMMGFTTNILTMGGLVLGVGMMVDNSIVVLDSCFKAKTPHKTPMEAAIEGTKFVMSSITGGTITTVVVFLPLASIAGMSGQLFGPLGYTIVFSLLASLVSAITLVPLFFTQYHPEEKRSAPAALFLKKLERGYGKLMKKLLKKKKTVLSVSVALLALSLVFASMLNVELMPSMDEGIISIEMDTKPGLNLEGIEALTSDLEEMVYNHEEVDHYTLSAGGSGLTSLMGSSSATVTAYLKDDKKMTTDEVIEEWRRQTQNMLDCDINISSSSSMSMGSMSSDAVDVDLRSNNLDAVREAAKQVEAVMAEHPDIIRVTSTMEDASPQAEVVVDPVKAAAYGMTPMQVGSSVYMALNGQETVSIRKDNHDYAIWVEYPQDKYNTVTDLNNLILISPAGKQVALMDIAAIEFADTPQTITRQENQYSVTVSATPTLAAKYSAEKELRPVIEAMELPAGVELHESSMQEMMGEEFTALGVAIVVAVLLVFMVMAIQFESIKYSLMVMICIPFSLIGSFSLLYFSGSPLSMTSLLGFLILVGSVVNNGILFVDTANQYRKSMDVETALVHTGRSRLRSILMTTLTTVLSMLPLIFGGGASNEMMKGLGIVVAGGLTASTILTLLLLPTFYLALDGNPERKKKKEWKRRMTLESKESQFE